MLESGLVTAARRERSSRGGYVRRGSVPRGAALAHRPGPARYLLTVEEAAEALGVGRTTMYDLLRTGRVCSVRIGRRRLVPPTALSGYVATLSSTGDA